jgi:hypothetical protein
MLTLPKMLPPPPDATGPGEDQVSPDVTEKDTVTFAGGKDSAFAEREIAKRKVGSLPTARTRRTTVTRRFRWTSLTTTRSSTRTLRMRSR